jgi:hypothetical protein
MFLISRVFKIKVWSILQGFGKFVCSHLIIPEQTGTSDSCVTLKEENIFEVQDKNQLLTLGWIHVNAFPVCLYRN